MIALNQNASPDLAASRKVLYHFRTRGRGAEAVHIGGIASALERLGYPIVFSNPAMIDPRQSAGANPFASGRRRSWIDSVSRILPSALFEFAELAYNAVAFLRNRRLLTGGDFAFIYERHAFFLFATALLARARGIPLVVEVNELIGDERVRKQPLLAPMARLADRITFKIATLIVVVSPHLQRRIASTGIAAEKIIVMPNAIDANAADASEGRDAVRARLGFEDGCVIAFVGWFVPWHHLDWLVQAFAALAPAAPDLRLMLVGDGPLRSEIEAEACRGGVTEKLTITGAVEHRSVGGYVAAADIAVIPHSNEYRSPIKLFEYMAQGRAIVAPATEPVQSVLQDGVNALLFPPGDKIALQEQLARLVADASLRERLGQRARADVFARHTWDHNARKVLARLSL